MKLFKGKFNHQGEIHEFYTKALDKNKAFMNFIYQLDKKLDLNPLKLCAYFQMDKRPKYEIMEVK